MLPHIRRKNTLNSQSAFFTHSAVCSLHFLPSLHYVSGLHSAVCIFYQQVSVAAIQFIYTKSTTKYLCVSKFDIFVLFRVNTLSFCKNVDITCNVSVNPPIRGKITLARIACLCLLEANKTLLYLGFDVRQL